MNTEYSTMHEEIDNMDWIKCPDCEAYMEYDDFTRGGDICLNCNSRIQLQEKASE